MRKGIVVALAGNPNAGKTTIFNHLTGSHQHVGNYPGITVDKKSGTVALDGENITVVDLPGTYSLTAYSQEEVVARRMLADERPDVVLHVVDAGALERNLYLTVQFMELGVPIVIALNMMDEVRARGDSIDAAGLARQLGIPVIETVGRVGLGVEAAFKAAVTLAKEKKGQPWNPPLTISYSSDLDPALVEMSALVQEALAAMPEKAALPPFPARWIALKYLESDQDIRKSDIVPPDISIKLDARCALIAKHLADTLHSFPEATIADFRYGYIASVLRSGIITRHIEKTGRRVLSDRIDNVLTHRLFGPIILAGLFFVIYHIAFTLGSIPMDMVEGFFDWLAQAVGDVLPDGLVKSMIVSGVIKGTGGVLVFVPLVLIIFLLISFLEDSGYMARIAYMLDRIFRIFGLHGSSVMPYIISGGIAGGCAVPGIMATRILRSPKEKLATILTLPFMTCGAKIPVFMLIVGIFFKEREALVMWLITLTGWVLALLSARVLRSTLITGEPTPFVMELPPYRLPTLRGLLMHTWERGWQYIKKAGTIILAISILVWTAMTFPALPEAQTAAFTERKAPLEARIETLRKAAETAKPVENQAENPVQSKSKKINGEEAPDTPEEKTLTSLQARLDAINHEETSAALRHSLAGRIGTALEPVTQWAGFEWRINIALLAGFTAKEVLVSTLGTAYSLGEVDPEGADSLAVKIKEDPHWNEANALSLIIFVLLYAPCMVTIITMKSETGGWRWPIFSLLFNTALAYVLAVAVYQIGKTLL